MVEKNRENKELLAIKNANKTIMAKVTKVLSAIDFESKYNWAISNADIDIVKNLRLIGIKKYLRCVGKIEDKVDWLHKD